MKISLQKLQQLLPLMEGVEKSLSAEIQLDTLRSAQSSLLFSLGAQNPELMAQGIARAKTLVTKFRGEVTNLIRDFSSKQISQAEALVRWKELSGKTYKDLFTAGTQAAGNPYYQKLGLTRKDVAFISSARRDETKHFKNFLEDIEAGRGQIDYEERAGFYADSGMGQFWNGQVAGHGDDVLIRWVLQPVMTDHCQDCVMLSSKTYTWKTLPFVPRSCNTTCLMNCACELIFDSLRPERPPGLPGVPGRGSAAAITAPGRNVMVFDDKGNIMLGGLQKTLDDLYSQLYKARQMITASETAAERTDWIRIRREINEAIVKARGNYKAMPTISVSTLTDVVKSAMRSGGVVTSLTELKVGAEVVFIRGDYSAFGVVKMLRNQLCFSSSTGVTLPVNDETDVVFVLGKRPAVFPAEQRILSEQQASPNKKLVSKLLNKDPNLVAQWMKIYDDMVRNGSVIPLHTTWIRFRELYFENPYTGVWHSQPEGVVESAVESKLEEKEADNVICSKCNTKFDYTGQSEIAMGAVVCPNCETILNQEGIAMSTLQEIQKKLRARIRELLPKKEEQEVQVKEERKGSGNWGHGGRPGKRGGSASKVKK